VSTADRRTAGELLAESDALVRETLLDATLEHAPAMVRSWNQLVGSAAKLWTVLPSEPNNTSGADPMEQLRVIVEAIGRSVTTGHWPGHGRTDEHLTQIADNLSRARHLVERHSRPSQPAPPETQADTLPDRGQVMHTLYVAARGTAVALGAYVTDLQRRLEIATRRRQPMAERPTILEITAARGIIARFAAMSSRRRTCSGSHSPRRTLASWERRHRPYRWKQPWLPGRFRHTAPWPPVQIRPI
jgi:hypothetical protein